MICVVDKPENEKLYDLKLKDKAVAMGVLFHAVDIVMAANSARS